MQCICCQENVNYIDYKDRAALRRFVSGSFKIRSSGQTKLCKQHQELTAQAVKRARFMALLPYTRNQVTKR